MSTATRKPRVFISRTTAGLKALAEPVAEVLRQRGIEPIIQTGFYPSTHDVKGMLAEHLQQCDAVICLIGSAYGSGPHDPITKTDQPVHGLKDPRTKDRLFSYTQLELLIARDLGRPIYTFFIEGDALPTAFAPEPPELAQRQQTFITEFAKDGRNTYGTFSQWDQPADPARGLKQAIEAIQFEITVLAGKPTNLPYTSLGTLFKGRDEFLAELRQHLTAEGPVVIKGKRTIHGMGGVGKTRAAIEYAWKHADDYRALLFISADTPEALHRNLAALCGPLVLNLPEQNEREQALQVEAALRWLKLHPGWFLIIDNVDTDEAAEETKALLAKLATGHVLITSRIADWTGHVRSLDLDVLSEAASIAFLDERTEERRPKKDDDREKVAALVQLLDCLALGLEQAGAHISASAISYSDYISLWESHRSVALTWHDEEIMKYPKSIAITYETSVGQLSDGAKALFHIFSWFSPEAIPRNLVESCPNLVAARRYLGEVEHIHLARYHSNGRTFGIHRLNQEIARREQHSAEPPPQLLAALNLVNDVFVGDPTDVREWPILEPLFPHAKSVATFADGHRISDPTARLLMHAAMLNEAKARYAEAEPMLRRALEIDEAIKGRDHPDVASILNNLAQVLKSTDHVREAILLMRRALVIHESSLGPSHTFVAADLNNLAQMLMLTGELAEVEPLMNRGLAIEETNQGTNHPTVAIQLNNLAQLFMVMHRFAEAEPLMRRSILINEAHYGIKHPKVALNRLNLAQLLQLTNRPTEAEALVCRALEILIASYGENHPEVALALNNLADLLAETNRLEEAESTIRRALAIDESVFGEFHSSIAIDLGNLASILQRSNRLAEAEASLSRALAIDEVCYGYDHPKVAIRLNHLAGVFMASGRLAEAEPLARQTALIMLRQSKRVGVVLPNLIVCLGNYAGVLHAWKGPDPVMVTISALGVEAGFTEEELAALLAGNFHS